ncbi:MAG TPA: antibiotic biosynthesis monooxygenase [Chloroflexota bacterium]|nr:antibiotic biosynthesis monooxygenase [Chloroflexota bacterium]
MDTLYGMVGRFEAQPGQGDALAAVLVAAGEGLRSNDECFLYLVNRAPDNPDLVYVMEAWKSREAHDQSLRDPGAQEAIGRARSLIVGISATEMRPEGGKGI